MRNMQRAYHSPSPHHHHKPRHNTHTSSQACTTHRTHARRITDAATAASDDWAWLLRVQFVRRGRTSRCVYKPTWRPLAKQFGGGRWQRGWVVTALPVLLASFLVPPLRYDCPTPMICAHSFCPPQCAHPSPETAAGTETSYG